MPTAMPSTGLTGASACSPACWNAVHAAVASPSPARTVGTAPPVGRPAAEPLRLHPNLAAVYRQKVMALEEALNDETDRAEAQAIIRALIDRVVLVPAEDGGMRALLYGELSALLALGSGAGIKNPGLVGPGCQLSVVAGARNRHCLLFVATGVRQRPGA